MKTIIRNFISLLRRFKVATTLNILGLTVAFAAFMLIFMQVKYDLSFNKNIPDGDKIVRVELFSFSQWGAISPRPFADFLITSSPHIIDGSYNFAVSAEQVIEVEKDGHKNMYWEKIETAGERFPEVFNFEMIEGNRTALAEPNNALIPQSIAYRFFGDEPAVGKIIHTEASDFSLHSTLTVGGVYKDLPENSSIKNIIYTSLGDKHLDANGDFSYATYLVLDDIANADKVLENYYQNYHELFDFKNWGIEMRFTPFTQLHFAKDISFDSTEKTSYQTVLVLIGIAFVLLIIAAINYTNFSMALTPMRIKSINTQKVLGAEEGMLRKGLLLETITITFISFLLAVGAVYFFSTSSFQEVVTINTSPQNHLGIIGMTALIALFVAIFAGIYPAMYVTSFSPALVLKGSFGLSPKGRQLRNGLISFQYISSFILIICATFMFLQNHFMRHDSLGYDKDEILVAELNDHIRNNKNAFKNALLSYSGIEAVSFTQSLMGGTDFHSLLQRPMAQDQNIEYYELTVDSEFLNVLGISVTEGRNFRIEDEQKGNGFIFNQIAKNTYNLEVGQKIDTYNDILGFIPDVKFNSFRLEMSPMAFYIEKEQEFTPQFVYIKTSAGTNLRDAMAYIQTSLSDIDSAYPFKTWFLDDMVQQLYEQENNMMILITLFSLIAIFISIVGVFGLVIFESEYKIREIGIKKVFGSSTTAILIEYNKSYLVIVSICFLIASPLAYYGMNRWLENFTHKISLSPLVFIGAFILIAFITIVTVTFQNWKVASSNPVDSIKSE